MQGGLNCPLAFARPPIRLVLTPRMSVLGIQRNTFAFLSANLLAQSLPMLVVEHSTNYEQAAYSMARIP
jgi:hypothetical protein